MMFDKNLFKDKFRDWVNENIQLSEHDALSYCYETIPSSHHEEFRWLIEQSVQWFVWVKEERYKRTLALSDPHLHSDLKNINQLN